MISVELGKKPRFTRRLKGTVGVTDPAAINVSVPVKINSFTFVVDEWALWRNDVFRTKRTKALFQ